MCIDLSTYSQVLLVTIMSIRYKVYEFCDDIKERESSLLVFIYDVPYIDACGIFPPYHILNQILVEGGDQGGMGPGATWIPFTLTSKQYNELIHEIENHSPTTFNEQVRFGYIQFARDPSLDYITDRFEWFQAACEKHRSNYHQKLTSLT